MLKRGISLTALGLLLCSGAGLHAAGLRLEGKLIVRNGNADGARMVVVSKDETTVLDRGLDHILLDLKLHASYLIAFERPGFISKQLLFNTGVPEGMDADYSFPFQVTLDALPQGQPLEYAGPVGYIHFDAQINAFGYSTDYRIAKDEALDERLRAADRKPAAVVAMPLNTGSTPLPAARNPYAQLAPTISKVSPVVHVLASSPLQQQTAPRGLVSGELIGPSQKRPDRGMLLARVDGPDANGDLTSEPGQATREVLVEPLRVITVVKRQQEGRVIEYRRVASYYGGVTYFEDGRPCSADTYHQGIGR